MAEVDPAVLAERVLRLKGARLFGSFDLADLAILAAAGRDQLCRERTQLIAEGERATAHWVALAGALRALYRGKPVPGDPTAGGFGALSLLSGRPSPCDLFAEPGSVLFVLDADALMSTLEERGRIARAVLQSMARSALAVGVDTEQPARGPCVVAPRGSPAALDLVSRMVVLRNAVALGARHGSALVRLARAARPERVPAGSTLWPDCRAPADLVIVLDGAVDTPPRWQPQETSQTAVYGLMEAPASVPRSVRCWPPWRPPPWWYAMRRSARPSTTTMASVSADPSGGARALATVLGRPSTPASGFGVRVSPSGSLNARARSRSGIQTCSFSP